MTHKRKFFLVGVLLLVLGGYFGFQRYIEYRRFYVFCTAHLKRAANANTIELAKPELDKALLYIEHQKLTKGSTTLVPGLTDTPDEDLHFWYENLKAARADLDRFPDNEPTRDVLKKLTLLKLKETIIDHTMWGEEVTLPPDVDSQKSFFLHTPVLMTIVILGCAFIWLSYRVKEES